MESKKIGLFIPTYNVDGRVKQVLEGVPSEVLQRLERVYIFDNRSSDKTVDRCVEWANSLADADKVRVFKNTANYLLGGSTMLAFKEALNDRLDFLICMHSDGQASPLDLQKFIDAIDEPDIEYDFILGSRMLNGSDRQNYSNTRLIFNLIFACLQRLVLKTTVYDIGAFIGFNLKTIARFPAFNICPDMGYHPYLIMAAAQNSSQKLKFKEFPIFWGAVETTNVNVIKYAIVHFWRILRLLMGIRPFQRNFVEGMMTERVFPKEASDA
ncbi:MAG: glycosyltransferase family 2 protein [Bdellovibrionales bacterium]